jgi:hypothetical protein
MNEMNNRPNPEESSRDNKEIIQNEDKMDIGGDLRNMTRRIGKKTMPYGAERALNAYKT